jgi:hypothetical protein
MPEMTIPALHLANIRNEMLIDRLITHEADDDDRGDAVTRLRRQIAAQLRLMERCNIALAHRFRRLRPTRFFSVDA